MKIISNIQQGTADWLSLKAGKFSGSEIYKLMGAKGFGQTGETYIYEVAASQITGKLNAEFDTFAMRRGSELEPLARIIFEKTFSVIVEEAAAFLPENSNEFMISPDGYFRIENNGFYGLEIKCPLSQGNHLYYSLIKTAEDLKNIEPKYYWQVQMALLISEFSGWYFTSFHPDYPDDKKLHTALIKPVQNDIELLQQRINQAIMLKNEIIKKL